MTGINQSFCNISKYLCSTTTTDDACLSLSPCPCCTFPHVRRNGTHQPSGSQKLQCKDCGRNFRKQYARLGWKEGSDRKIRRHLLEGKSVRSIASQFGVSPNTVQSQKNTLDKDFLQLIRQAYKTENTVLEGKSPLRYPGGKAKALDVLLPFIPTNIQEFREPFAGGASVALAVKSLFGDRLSRVWINDIQPDIAGFWQVLRDDSAALIQEIMGLRQRYPAGRSLYQHLIWSLEPWNLITRAARFFILNCITFSGVIEAGGYSEQAFKGRFTGESINKLGVVAPLLKGINITALSFETLLEEPRKQVFLHLDPPYFSAQKLYGERGEVHASFDHQRFAYHAQRSQHRWLITYDDSPEIRQLFKFAKISDWRCQYTMNNYKQSYARKGGELLIREPKGGRNCNYRLKYRKKVYREYSNLLHLCKKTQSQDFAPFTQNPVSQVLPGLVESLRA